MDRRFRRSLFLALALGGLGACAALPVRSPPIQEMSDARQAVEAAGEAQAGTYDRPALTRAQAHLAWAEQALELRAYDEARVEALAAKEDATSARRVAIALRRAQAAIGEAQRLGVPLEDAEALLGRAQALVESGDEAGALALADRASALAEAEVNRRYLDLAKGMLARLDLQRARLGPDELVRYDAARAAVVAGEGRQAYELARGLPSGPAARAVGQPGRPTDRAAEP